MRKTKKLSAIKLIEKFDQQLCDMLISELQVMRKARVKMINRISFKSDQENLRIA